MSVSPTSLESSAPLSPALAFVRATPSLTRIADEPSEVAAQAAAEIAAVGRIASIPILLETLCDTTGLRFAAVGRLEAGAWTPCAVLDGIGLSLDLGRPLSGDRNLHLHGLPAGLPLVIDQLSRDPRFRDVAAARLYRIESYVSVPIMLATGRTFGTLCALDQVRSRVSNIRVIAMLDRFARLIALDLERELQRQRTDAALLDERATGELREQFIAVLGHDLRNPLQAIQATGALLERRLADPQLASMATRMLANARRMSGLIDDVLDFARGRLGGGLSLDLCVVDDFGAKLTEVVAELKDAEPDRQIHAHFDVALPMQCDLRRVQQLVSNLVGNALAHSAPGTPVRVSAGVHEDYLVLQVWNEGEPIPVENLHRIFEPFWREFAAHHSRGLGLGLHICAQIVRAHGGRLSVISNRENGTQFTARLPLRMGPHTALA